MHCAGAAVSRLEHIRNVKKNGVTMTVIIMWSVGDLSGLVMIEEWRNIDGLEGFGNGFQVKDESLDSCQDDGGYRSDGQERPG